ARACRVQNPRDRFWRGNEKRGEHSVGRRRYRLVLDRHSEYRGLYSRSAFKLTADESQPLPWLAARYKTDPGLSAIADSAWRPVGRRQGKRQDIDLGRGRRSKRQPSRIENDRARRIYIDCFGRAQYRSENSRWRFQAWISDPRKGVWRRFGARD